MEHYEVQGSIRESGGTLFIIVGMQMAVLDAASYLEESGTVMITRMNTPEKLRGRGIGKQLLAEFFKQAAAKGFTRAIVAPGGYDPERQGDRIRFYERNGFVQQEDEPELYVKSLV